MGRAESFGIGQAPPGFPLERGEVPLLEWDKTFSLSKTSATPTSRYREEALKQRVETSLEKGFSPVEMAIELTVIAPVEQRPVGEIIPKESPVAKDSERAEEISELTGKMERLEKVTKSNRIKRIFTFIVTIVFFSSLAAGALALIPFSIAVMLWFSVSTEEEELKAEIARSDLSLRKPAERLYHVKKSVDLQESKIEELGRKVFFIEDEVRVAKAVESYLALSKKCLELQEILKNGSKDVEVLAELEKALRDDIQALESEIRKDSSFEVDAEHIVSEARLDEDAPVVRRFPYKAFFRGEEVEGEEFRSIKQEEDRDKLTPVFSGIHSFKMKELNACTDRKPDGDFIRSATRVAGSLITG